MLANIGRGCAVLLAAWLGLPGCGNGSSGSPTIPTTYETAPELSIQLDSQTLLVEVARTRAARKRPLSSFRALEEGDGLLVLFPCQRVRQLPLHGASRGVEILLYNGDGDFVERHDLAARRPGVFVPSQPVLCALVLPVGRSEQLGLTARSRLTGVEPAGAQEDCAAIRIGEVEAAVEVASTRAQRARGLMFRPRLEADSGMLFLYREEKLLSFWMKDTRVPLTVAFLGRDRRIQELRDLEPGSTESVASSSPAAFALEMPRGWFQKNGVEPGRRVDWPGWVEAILPEADW